LRHRGGCRREECAGRNNAECDFSHEILLSLLRQINALVRGVVPQKAAVLKVPRNKKDGKFDGTNCCSRMARRERSSTMLKKRKPIFLKIMRKPAYSAAIRSASRSS
jgi:hypothetical protein